MPVRPLCPPGRRARPAATSALPAAGAVGAHGVRLGAGGVAVAWRWGGGVFYAR